MKNSLKIIYDKLFAHYGDLKWWPGGSAYEIIVGAVLTQNCAWSNVEKAIANFGERLSPEFVLSDDSGTLGEIIRPAGFFTRKAAYLKAVTEWFAKYDFSAEKIAEKSLHEIRAELLGVMGIGRETADSILLYAAGLPTFVIDAYTKRLCGRFPISDETDYEKLKKLFEENLPRDVFLYNNFHAAIVNLCKDFCRKKPLCGECPLGGFCGKNI
ncbi:MAG: endonuclease [Ruminococcus sp.]|jgi:endonuclease-3 related protein|nr:endonuclease [Ruminococcus sp.]